MTTLTHLAGTRPLHDVATVDIAGVAWPVHKLAAVIVGVFVALITLVGTGSGVAAMWTTGAAVLVVWWGMRALQTSRDSES